MSDQGMACGICGAPVSSWGAICSGCSKAKQEKQRLARAPQGSHVAAAPAWEYELQTANSMKKGGNAKYKNVYADILPIVMNCINQHHTDAGATNAGDQYTIWQDGKNDNLTVDYQGTRAGGTAGSFWIDIQGQDGKGDNRETYFQIMVEVHASEPPPEVVMAAIQASAKSDKKRAVVFCTAKRPR